MKRSRFPEEQIIAILQERERGGEDGGRVPQAWDQQHYVLRLESQVRSGRI